MNRSTRLAVFTTLILIPFFGAAAVVRAGEYSGANGVNDPTTPLNGEYRITVQQRQLGPEQWNFSYTVHNNNQQAGSYTGFDGLQIEIPTTAVLTDIIVPTAGAWRTLTPTQGEITFWGYSPATVYPIGSDPVCSFTASNVSVGIEDAFVTTYWSYTAPANYPYYLNGDGEVYTGYATTVAGPVAVPEPASLSLLAFGGLGLLVRRRGARG